jgi:hypothetical protein
MSRKNGIKRPRVQFFNELKNAEGFAKKVNGTVKTSKDGKPYVKYQPTEGYKGTKTDGYDEWWQENNLNGGFAYNGVTDDF